MSQSDREWSSKKNETIRDEARMVLDAQREIILDIDDKAMRTVRILLLVLGLTVSVIQFTNVSFHPVIGGIAITSWLLSILFALITYGMSNVYLGLNRQYLNYLRIHNPREEIINMNGPNVPKWESDLIFEYGGWIEENAEDIKRNSALLQWTQGFLFIGLVAAVVATIL